MAPAQLSSCAVIGWRLSSAKTSSFISKHIQCKTPSNCLFLVTLTNSRYLLSCSWVHHVICIPVSVLKESCRKATSNHNFLSGVFFFLLLSQSHSLEFTAMTGSCDTDQIKSNVWSSHGWKVVFLLPSVSVTFFKLALWFHTEGYQPPHWSTGTHTFTHTYIHSHWCDVYDAVV